VQTLVGSASAARLPKSIVSAERGEKKERLVITLFLARRIEQISKGAAHNGAVDC